ncbi:MAG: hypothetical protein AB7G11_11710 [Phycisphaerales bacterium]
MSVDHAAKLGTLLDRLARDYPDAEVSPIVPAIEPDEPLLAELVRSLLLWECTQTAAASAMRRIEAAVVDFNELRVCLPGDLVRLIGEDYPAALDRAERLRATLGDLYRHHHAVTLRHVQDLGKREAKQYLDTLSGVPPFVSARVALLGHGNHSMPMDSRIYCVLAEAKAVPSDDGVDAAAGWVERRVRAGELTAAYIRLQARADEIPIGPADSGVGGNQRARSSTKAKPSKSKSS